MSFKKGLLYPCSPVTERGVSTKLSVAKDKLIYANGKSVIIRDLNNPALATAYSGHVRNVSVARFSPSGYYCASADVQGTVRIWDTVGEDRILKGEYRVISGKVNDLAWDGESKRIIAVGDGKEKFGYPFMFDAGTSTGQITGHSKPINAVSIRQQRPFRAVTASDDRSIVFHQGVPYKYDKTIRTHNGFVQDVQYAASGDHFVSVGSDSKIFIFDGKTGDTLGEFDENGHNGTIMACSWSPDDKTIVTSGSDRTVKLWDVETRKSLQSWSLGTELSHQQVGNAWTASGDIISLSVSGDLNVFDQRVGDKPSRILRGPQKAITAGTLTSSGTFLVGTSDGRVIPFSSAGEAGVLEGESHTNIVTGFASVGDTVYSVGWDDRLREISAEGKGFTEATTTLAVQPKAIAAAQDGSVFVAEIDRIEVFRSNQNVAELKAGFHPLAVAALGQVVAAGGEDNKVHLYDWDGKALNEVGLLEGHRSNVTSIAFSPDGTYLASGDSTGKIVIFDVKERKLIESRWTNHSGRIHSLSWASDSVHLASGSLDTHVYIWSVKKPLANIAIRNAVPGGVNYVAWVENDDKTGMVMSVGADSCVRTWEVTFKT